MFVDMKSNRQLQSGVIWSCQSCFGLIRSFTPQKLLIFFFLQLFILTAELFEYPVCF